MAISFNKGEWAELYVFFYVLGEGKLRCADREMNEIKGQSFPITYILRQEKRGPAVKYAPLVDQVIIDIGDKPYLTVPCKTFAEYAEKLKRDIIAGSGHSFSVSEDVTNFMKRVCVFQPKARSVQRGAVQADHVGGKCDIVMHFPDPWTHQGRDGGFSIKSAFSSPATLFNASQGSNFAFALDTDDEEFINTFNNTFTSAGAIDFMGRGDLLRESGYHLASLGPCGTDNKGNLVFKTNLKTLRPDLVDILPEMLRISFLNENHPTQFPDVCALLAEENPAKMDNPSIYYRKALEDFLYASFAGMTAGKPWNSKMQVNGGYIIVTDHWKVLSYPTTNADEFKDYLFKNVRLERAKAGRNKYGDIYRDKDGLYKLKLNLQVRFIK